MPILYERTWEDKYDGVHVDDSLLVFQDRKKCDDLIKFLNTKRKVKDLGEIKHALGIDFVVDADGVSLCQIKYVEAVLKTLGFDRCNPVPTPVLIEDPVANKLSETLLAHPLQKIVGMLLWLSVMTRPDIAYAVAKLAQEVSKPTPASYSRAARILRYLRGTKDVGISNSNKEGRGKRMHAYVDADWAGDLDRHSQWAGIMVSKKQPTIALSSTEAEIVAATGCVQEATWYQGCFQELGIGNENPMIIYEDNSAAIALSETSVIGKRTRHIDIKYKFLNECVELGKIKLVEIEGAKNVADIFTKPLSRDRFRMLSARMAHSTSLLVPQPMTMDQDGPNHCAALRADGKAYCRSKPYKDYK